MKDVTSKKHFCIPLAAAVLVLFGLTDFYARNVREIRASARMRLQGAFWEGRDRHGHLLWKTGPGRPRLDAGESLCIPGRAEEHLLLRTFVFTGMRTGAKTRLHIVLQQGPKSALIIDLAPAVQGGASLAVKSPNGKTRIMDRRGDLELLGPPRRPFTVKLENRVHGFSVKIQGKPVFSMKHSLRAPGSITLTPEGGPLIPLRLAVEGAKRSGTGPYTSCRYVEDFRNLYREAVSGKTMRLLLHLLLLAAGVLVFLRALCPGGVPLTRLLAGGAYALLPPVLFVEAAQLLDLDSLLPLLALFLAGGLAWAWKGLGDARLVQRPASASGNAVALLAAAGVLFLVAWDAGTHATRRYAASVAAERAVIEHPAHPSPFKLAEKRSLAPGEVLSATGTFRNMNVRLRVIPQKGALLQVRLRAPRANRHRNLSFLLSTDPGKPSGFYVEMGAERTLLEKGCGVFPAGRPIELSLSVRGRGFTAHVNRKPVAHARCRRFPQGAVVLQAMEGEVRVERFEVLPAHHRERIVSTLPDFILWAAGPTVFLLFYACLLSLLSTVPFLRAAQGTAFALYPVGCGLILMPAHAFALLPTSPAAFFCSAVLFPAFLFAKRRTLPHLWRWIVLAAALVLGAVWAASGLGLWSGPPWT